MKKIILLLLFSFAEISFAGVSLPPHFQNPVAPAPQPVLLIPENEMVQVFIIDEEGDDDIIVVDANVDLEAVRNQIRDDYFGADSELRVYFLLDNDLLDTFEGIEFGDVITAVVESSELSAAVDNLIASFLGLTISDVAEFQLAINQGLTLFLQENSELMENSELSDQGLVVTYRFIRAIVEGYPDVPFNF